MNKATLGSALVLSLFGDAECALQWGHTTTRTSGCAGIGAMTPAQGTTSLAIPEGMEFTEVEARRSAPGAVVRIAARQQIPDKVRVSLDGRKGRRLILNNTLTPARLDVLLGAGNYALTPSGDIIDGRKVFVLEAPGAVASVDGSVETPEFDPRVHQIRLKCENFDWLASALQDGFILELGYTTDARPIPLFLNIQRMESVTAGVTSRC